MNASGRQESREETSVEELGREKSLQTHNKYQSSLSTSIKLFPPITCIFIDTQNAYLFLSFL